MGIEGGVAAAVVNNDVFSVALIGDIGGLCKDNIAGIGRHHTFAVDILAGEVHPGVEIAAVKAPAVIGADAGIPWHRKHKGAPHELAHSLHLGVDAVNLLLGLLHLLLFGGDICQKLLLHLLDALYFRHSGAELCVQLAAGLLRLRLGVRQLLLVSFQSRLGLFHGGLGGLHIGQGLLQIRLDVLVVLGNPLQVFAGGEEVSKALRT